MLILLNVLLTYSKPYPLSILRLPTNMEKTLFAASLSAALITVLALGASSCATKEDLLNVNDKLEKLDLRVGRLEQMCKQMNENITALQTLVNALNKRDAITDITPLKQGDASGYTITFLSGKTITIYHGKDGHSPVIGLKEMDGNYYWTIDGEPLIAGNDFIKANGVDAVAPQLKIQNGRWLLSTDGGSTWKDVGQATGDPGKDAVEYFQNVDSSSDPDYVTFVLADGTTLRIPKANDIITFSGLDDLLLGPNGTFTFNYQVRSDKAIVAVSASLFDNDTTIANIEVISDEDKAVGQINITTTEHINRHSAYIIVKAIKEDNKVLEQAAMLKFGDDITIEEEIAFDYYGTSNCILIKPEDNVATMDVSPHTTILGDYSYYVTPSSAPRAAEAKWIWYETQLQLEKPQLSGNQLTITRNNGYGNAVVGIFSDDGKILWSFHVWCPTIDPTTEENLKTYDGHKVMPMTLGADNPKGNNGANLGLYYQWGRKDPLGRARSLDQYEKEDNNKYIGSIAYTEYKLANYVSNNEEILGICPKLTNSDKMFGIGEENFPNTITFNSDSIIMPNDVKTIIKHDIENPILFIKNVSRCQKEKIKDKIY